MKVASFHVRATEAQSRRWKQAAEAEGHASAGTWLAYAADAYLKVRARAGRPIPLAWHRGAVRVVLNGQEATIRGSASPPFLIYRGTAAGPSYEGCRSYTLVHQPTRRVIATLRSNR